MLGHAQQSVEAESCTTDVANVKGKTAECYHESEEIAKARQNFVCHILAAQARNTDDAPYVELGDDVKNDGAEDDSRKGCHILRGEGRGLGQKAGANGRSSH